MTSQSWSTSLTSQRASFTRDVSNDALTDAMCGSTARYDVTRVANSWNWSRAKWERRAAGHANFEIVFKRLLFQTASIINRIIKCNKSFPSCQKKLVLFSILQLNASRNIETSVASLKSSGKHCARVRHALNPHMRESQWLLRTLEGGVAYTEHAWRRRLRVSDELRKKLIRLHQNICLSVRARCENVGDSPTMQIHEHSNLNISLKTWSLLLLCVYIFFLLYVELLGFSSFANVLKLFRIPPLPRTDLHTVTDWQRLTHFENHNNFVRWLQRCSLVGLLTRSQASASVFPSSFRRSSRIQSSLRSVSRGFLKVT